MGYRPCASTTIMRNTLHVILAATNLFGVAAAAPIYTVDYTSGASAPEPSSTNSSAASNANSDDGYSCGRGAAAAGILFLVVFLCCCCCCIKKMMCGGCGRGRCGSGHGRCGHPCRTSVYQGQRGSSRWHACGPLDCKVQRRSAGEGWVCNAAAEPNRHCAW